MREGNTARSDRGGRNKNVLILTKEGVDARVGHITSFLSYVKMKEARLLPTLLGLQGQNEAYLRADQLPFPEAVDNMVRVRDLALEVCFSGHTIVFEQARLYPAASDWPLFIEKMGDFDRPGDETSEESK